MAYYLWHIGDMAYYLWHLGDMAYDLWHIGDMAYYLWHHGDMAYYLWHLGMAYYLWHLGDMASQLTHNVKYNITSKLWYNVAATHICRLPESYHNVVNNVANTSTLWQHFEHNFDAYFIGDFDFF